MDAAYVIGELATISTMAFALSMDAFSVGLGIGMMFIRLKRIALISGLTGLFHMMMPFIGITIGKMLTVHFGEFAVIFGGCLLIAIGLSMIRSSFQFEKNLTFISPYGIGLFLFPFSVSIDSISAGLSLGMFGAKTFATVVIFGLVSTVLTMSGLVLARKFHRVFGKYSMALGGIILLTFGVKMIVSMSDINIRWIGFGMHPSIVVR